jgi:hypothetical protein
MRILYTVIYLFLVNVVYCQLTDNFNDGNFTSNLSWKGNTESFIVDPLNRLRLNASGAGNSVLYIDATYPPSFSIEMTIKQEFNPSGSNFSRLYFLADNTDLAKSNSYYLQFGENGTEDAVRFYKQTNGSSSLLSSGKLGSLNTDSSFFKIFLTRFNEDNFNFSIDYNLDGKVDDEFSANDASIKNSAGKYFGIYALFSSTRKDKFAWDDFSLKPISGGDMIAPAISNVIVVNNKILQVIFSEAIDRNILSNLKNFDVVGLGNPTSATMDDINNKTIELKFNSDFNPFTNYSLEVISAKDLAGNIAPTLKYNFSFSTPIQLGDVVLTEILFDPYVNQQDFIELYNTTNNDIDLKGCKIKSFANNQEQTIETSVLIKSKSYLALTPSMVSVASTYSPPSNVVIINQSLPSMNNDKGNISFTSSLGIILDSFTYSDQLHTIDKTEKNIEGVSLEKINFSPYNNEFYHWKSSIVDTKYATPGYANSHLSDKTLPKAINAEIKNDKQIIVYFDEGLSFESIKIIENYTLNNGFNNPSKAEFNEKKSSQVLLTYTKSFLPTIDYALEIKNIKDVNNNIISATILPLLFSESPKIGDLILSEILFNPYTDGDDFIEIYNNSNKNISLQNLVLRNNNNQQSTTIAKGVLQSKKFLAFSINPNKTKAIYKSPDDANFYTTNLPAFNVDEGNVSIVFNNLVLDSFNYNEDLHNVFIDQSDRKGVSLEKIVLKEMDNTKSNWGSGSKATNYGTPGYKNSNNYATNGIDISSLFKITNKVFSPNDDGNKDLLIVEYNLPSAGFIANVKVYNSDGFPIKDLAQNELLGVNGIIKWDGYNSDNFIEKNGIYIIVGEVFNAEGDKKIFKKECVLSRL